jgi:hypothetical protein
MKLFEYAEASFVMHLTKDTKVRKVRIYVANIIGSECNSLVFVYTEGGNLFWEKVTTET